MTLETTSTTVEEIVRTEWIAETIMAAAKQFVCVVPNFQQFDLRGKGSGVVSVPRDISDTGTLADYDGPGETTTLANIQYDMSQISITPAEFGVKRTVTDIAVEDNIFGSSLIDHLLGQMPEDLAIAIDDDACALFGSLATSVGSTGVDLSLANMAQAIAQLRINEGRAPNGCVYILDDQQALDYDQALNSSTATTLAGYFTRSGDSGLSNGFLGTFAGQPVYTTSQTDSTGGTDVIGALFATGANPRTACFGVGISRLPRPEMFRDPTNRSTQVMMTMRMGVAEIFDLGGVKIVTDL